MRLIPGLLMAAVMWTVSAGCGLAANPVFAIIKTSMGEIKVELNAEKAPITVDNFVKYAEDGHYNGTIFHRVIPGFHGAGGWFGCQDGRKEDSSWH